MTEQTHETIRALMARHSIYASDHASGEAFIADIVALVNEARKTNLDEKTGEA